MTVEEKNKQNKTYLITILLLLFIGSLVYSHYVYMTNRDRDNEHDTHNHDELVKILQEQSKLVISANNKIAAWEKVIRRNDSLRVILKNENATVIKNYYNVYEKIEHTEDSLQSRITADLLEQHRSKLLERN